MSTVFFSGSRAISRINDVIRNRINNVMGQQLSVIVGDANGADKVMQSYLSQSGYEPVTVYCVGTGPRNNIGNWPVKHVPTLAGLKGREFYTVKDKAMAMEADFGLVLWDGTSAGSIANVIELLGRGKKSAVYFAPERQFLVISSIDDLRGMIAKCEPDSIKNFSRKSMLVGGKVGTTGSGQTSLAF